MREPNPSISTKAAGRLLGVSADLFEDIAKDYQWLRPFYLGKGKRRVKRWPRDGVLALLYLFQNDRPADGTSS